MNFKVIRETAPSTLSYDLDLMVSSQKVNGKKVRIFEVVPPIEESCYSDFSIDVIDDAGLIDKLAVQSPLSISVLSKQDAIYSSAQAIEQLGLQEQVELKKAEMKAALDALDEQRISQQDEQRKSQQKPAEILNN